MDTVNPDSELFGTVMFIPISEAEKEAAEAEGAVVNDDSGKKETSFSTTVKLPKAFEKEQIRFVLAASNALGMGPWSEPSIRVTASTEIRAVHTPERPNAPTGSPSSDRASRLPESPSPSRDCTRTSGKTAGASTSPRIPLLDTRQMDSAECLQAVLSKETGDSYGSPCGCLEPTRKENIQRSTAPELHCIGEGTLASGEYSDPRVSRAYRADRGGRPNVQKKGSPPGFYNDTPDLADKDLCLGPIHLGRLH